MVGITLHPRRRLLSQEEGQHNHRSHAMEYTRGDRAARIGEVSKTKAIRQRGPLIGLVYGESGAAGRKHLLYILFLFSGTAYSSCPGFGRSEHVRGRCDYMCEVICCLGQKCMC
jgi:hypothetical protein